jgi:CBS domain-containing protein
VKEYVNDPEKQRHSVNDIMKKDIHTITQYKSLNKAIALMEEHQISSLPVIRKKQLIGIITSKDI